MNLSLVCSFLLVVLCALLVNVDGKPEARVGEEAAPGVKKFFQGGVLAGQSKPIKFLAPARRCPSFCYYDCHICSGPCCCCLARKK